MFAVIQTSGKQYRVTSGDVLEFDKMAVNPGDLVVLDRVLSVGQGEDLIIGTPFLPNTRVEGTVLAQCSGPKVVIFKHKKRKNYRRTTGHRQPLTRIRVDAIWEDGQLLAGKEPSQVESALDLAEVQPVEPIEPITPVEQVEQVEQVDEALNPSA